jgi:hypothetical protein
VSSQVGDVIAGLVSEFCISLHLYTMESANNLLNDLYALGETEAARRLGEDILVRVRRVFGEESYLATDVARLMQNSETNPAITSLTCENANF